MSFHGFWGLQMEPGFTHSEEVTRPFTITMAALPETLVNSKRCTLGIKINDVNYALCSLIPEKTEQQLMNLSLQAGEQVSFYLEGDNSIHLTGSFNDSDRSDSTDTSDWIESRIHRCSEPNGHRLVTSSHRANGFVGEEVEDFSDDDMEQNLERQLMKRPLETAFPPSTKKRKEGNNAPPSPIPYNKNSDSQVQQLLYQMAKSMMDLPPVPKLPRERYSLPAEDHPYDYHHYQQKHSSLDPLDYSLPKQHQLGETYPLDRRSSHSSQQQQRRHSINLLHSHLPEPPRKQQQQRTTSETATQKDTTGKKRVRNDYKKSSEEKMLEAKLKQDKRLEARQQQEEKKKDKRLEHQKQRKQGSGKNTQELSSTLSISLSGTPSPRLSSQPRQEPLPDGFVVEDKRIGTGRPALFGDTVGLRFLGKMDNGKVFDKNISGELFKITIGNGDVPSAWNFSVQGMQLNGERKVTIPPPYAKDLHPDIPRTETATMDIQLLDLQDGVDSL